MERSQLIYVIETARQGNITKAAEVLHISQPSLSNQIIHLENELGVALFERTRRRVVLTDAGRVFVHEAEGIVNGFTSLEKLMGEFARKNTGSLRIGALSTMCSLKIPEMLHDFQEKHSGVSLSLLESGSAALVSALERDEIDAAFAVLNPALPYEGLVQVPLVSAEIYVAVSKKNPLMAKDAFTLEDLSGVSLISSTSDFSLFSIILSQMERCGIPYTITNRCNQVDSCLSLVDKNLGVTFCTDATAAYYPYPDLCLIPFSPPFMRDISLVYKKDPAYYPLLEAFIGEVMSFYKQ